MIKTNYVVLKKVPAARGIGSPTPVRYEVSLKNNNGYLGDVVQGEDGSWILFIDAAVTGGISEYLLKEIANILEELNKNDH